LLKHQTPKLDKNIHQKQKKNDFKVCFYFWDDGFSLPLRRVFLPPVSSALKTFFRKLLVFICSESGKENFSWVQIFTHFYPIFSQMFTKNIIIFLIRKRGKMENRLVAGLLIFVADKSS